MQVEAFLSTRRTNRVFRSCFVHMFQTTTLGTHDAPGHTGGKTQLLAFHHIEGAVKRNDDLALVVESITGRAFAVCFTIRRGRRFLFRGMSTATATAGTGFGPVASAGFSGVGANTAGDKTDDTADPHKNKTAPLRHAARPRAQKRW